ncbi:MAG TPA: SGNH/GDSL hydrolase family protein [Vicinamibacterales bacterium]|nr:SGNH/GDSL hydrolase family protein [Vicinamibacterales bacterium]
MSRRGTRFVTITIPVFVLTVLVALTAVEIWVRLSWNPKNGRPGLFVADARRGQRFAPDYDGWFAGVPVRINNLGFRDSRDYSLDKRANTFRIVVLGDSVTFGHGSVYEHTYPYLLEQRLKQWRKDVDWQVWNVAVPGYNTSQELEHLEEIGPVFAPDLVIVGFYENDLVDNRPLQAPGIVRVAAAHVLSFAERHIYSVELYKRVLIQLAWKLSSSDAYRRRLETINSDEKDLRKTDTLADAKQQVLTDFDRVSDDERVQRCVSRPAPSAAVVDAAQRQDGYQEWLDAVRGFQQLNRDGTYHIVFFLNVPPAQCPDTDDVFWDDGPMGMNGFLTRVIGEGGMPVASVHDALLHVRPSQMPGWAGHSFGNTNVVKADALFEYLRDRILPRLRPGFGGQAGSQPQTRTSAAAQ